MAVGDQCELNDLSVCPGLPRQDEMSIMTGDEPEVPRRRLLSQATSGQTAREGQEEDSWAISPISRELQLYPASADREPGRKTPRR